MKLFVMLRSRAVAVKSAAAAVLLVGSTAANAALPAWADDISTDVGQAITDVAALVGPLVVAALIAGIIPKLIKRFGNKI